MLKQPKKFSIFDRLGSEDNGKEVITELQQQQQQQTQKCQITGFSKTFTSSVFNRLGGKSDNDSDFIGKGILKNSPTKKSIISPISSSGAIVKRVSVPTISRNGQKVMLVKKIPAKAATMVADEIEMEKMELTEPLKCVSFSSEDEIVEIAPRRLIVKPRLKKIILGNNGKSIKTRLGLRSQDTLYQTRKTIGFKNESPRKKIILTQKLKSEQIKKELPIHKRLDFTNKKKINSDLVMKMEKVRLDPTSMRLSGSSNGGGGSSVFNRLG